MASPRIPGRVQDIPQTINVINQQTLQQQGVTTVDQALRNVPGVTVSSGEGNGGQKGPASESFGCGTTGGAINLQQKTARLGNFTDIEGTGGTGPLGRVVADMNRQLDATTAMRIVGMYHNQDIVGRDHLFSNRWGVLGSMGFGLGTGTQLTVNYLHQDGRRYG